MKDRVDVVVVGAGMAGVCAAIEAARAGARVAVLDAGGPLTCTTAMSGGHIYLGGGTPVQESTGWVDTPEAMAAYLRAVSPQADPAKIELYAQGSVEHFTWLEALGFEFERSYYPHKAVVQPGTQGLMFTGNELAWPFRDEITPAPRGHKPPVEGDLGGGAFVLKLALARLAELGVPVFYDTTVNGLLWDDAEWDDAGVPPGDGAPRLAGVSYRQFGQTGTLEVGSVILAAGGFVTNEEMVREYAPRLNALFGHGMALGNPHDDGSGIRLGEAAGGVADHLEGAFFTSPFYPPEDSLKGIVVNGLGQRFVAEDVYHSRLASFVFDQPERRAYLIFDSATMVEPAYGFAPLVDGWESVAQMEAALSIPAGALQATLADYNREAAQGRDPQWHKHEKYLVPLDQGPWGTYDLTPGACFYAGFSCGGLRVNADGQLLRTDGSTIEGVYAAGACASNIATDGRGYASGVQLGEASFFGRRAGRHAASRTRGQPAQGAVR